MLMPTNHVKVYLYRSGIDMRWGYDRIAGICSGELGQDPYKGQMFLFFNNAKNRARIFYYDGTGCCLFSKRLEVGAFQVSLQESGAATISASDLMLLLSGQPMPKPKVQKKWDSDEQSY